MEILGLHFQNSEELTRKDDGFHSENTYWKTEKKNKIKKFALAEN